MRVCLVQLTDFPEAGRTDIYEYSRALANIGVETHVVICRRADRQKLPNGLTAHELGARPSKNPLTALQFAWFARRTVGDRRRAEPFDLVHFFNPSPATFAALVALRMLPGRPRLIFDVRTGGLGRGLDAALINAMVKTAQPLADGMIFISEGLRDRFATDTGRPAGVVPLGVDVERFAQGPRVPQATFRFMYVGTLDRNRRLEALLRAFEMTRRSFSTIHLTFVGDGCGRRALDMHVRMRGLSQAVSFSGKVPYTDVPQYLHAADCGISYIPLTSWFDPQPPLKTLEYFASGLPVVATATRAHRDLWEHLPPALLTGDSPESFAEGMRYVVAQRGKIPADVFQRVARRFDWQRITSDRLLRFYERVVTAR